MPITQSRFLSIISVADGAISICSHLKGFVKETLPPAAASANSVLAHNASASNTGASTEPANTVIQELLGILTYIQNYLEAVEILDPEAISAVAIEKAHFQKSARRNDRASYYQEQARRRLGIRPREDNLKDAKIQQSASAHRPTEEVTIVSDDDPNLLKFLEQRKRADASANYAAEAAERKRLREEAKANGTYTEPLVNDPERKDVLTSVPPLSELYKKDPFDGNNPLS